MSADRLGARFLQDPLTRAFSTVLADVRSLDLGGQVADYIPELANVDADAFGIAATSIAGHTYATGDSATTFTIQSISKPFVFALVLAEIGFDRFLEHVGVEPSGEAFNAISFDDAGRPANPLINAGAIVTTSLMPATSADERFARIRDGLSVFAGRTLAIDQRVYDSESRTGNRNRALATLALSTGVLASSVDGAAEPYFQQCSLLIDTADLALMGATLANNGVNPRTGVRAVSAEVARHVLSVMSACGMYDRSGDWMVRVGMPAKSGVGGGIVAVAPGEYGIGVFSPPLDAFGNSSRGVETLRTLAARFGLHLFRHADQPGSLVQAIEFDPETATLSVRVRGALDFVDAERVVHETLAAATAHEFTTLVFDLSGVTEATPFVARVLHDLLEQARSAYTVTAVDPGGIVTGIR